MVGLSSTKNLYCTQITKQNEDKDVINTLNDGIENIIKSLGYMNWIGFCGTISNEILQFINDHTMYDFTYVFQDEPYRVSWLSSCEWGKNESNVGNRIVVFSCWDKDAKAIVPKLV